MVSKDAFCKVFNVLHDMDTEDIKRMEDMAYRDFASKDPKTATMGKLLQVQCRYVVELRERSGDPENKRPWRKRK